MAKKLHYGTRRGKALCGEKQSYMRRTIFKSFVTCKRCLKMLQKERTQTLARHEKKYSMPKR